MKSKQALAESKGVSIRTVQRWIARGCPCDRAPNGTLLFDEGLVDDWLARTPQPDEEAPTVGPSPAPPPPATPNTDRPRGLATKDAAQRADTARKIAQARQQEHELAQERGLKDLDLAARIRGATTADEVVRLDLEVAALVAAGAMKYQRGQALRQLLAQAQRALANAEETSGESKATYLVTPEARELALTFDRIGNGWRRRWVVEAVALHLAEDLKELPTWDGDMQPVLVALQLDAMGEPTSDAWPERFTPPAVASALIVPIRGATTLRAIEDPS